MAEKTGVREMEKPARRAAAALHEQPAENENRNTWTACGSTTAELSVWH